MNASSLIIAAAIVIAGICIAIALLIIGTAPQSGEPSLALLQDAQEDAQAPEEAQGDLTLITPPTPDDHIYGNPEAPLTLIEFSDLECVFCARIHPSLKAIVDESGGEVNWVYRHFPLSQIHPNALSGAYAAECLAEYGGDDAFWQFVDAILGSGEPVNETTYRTYARAADVDEEAVLACIADERYESLVAEHMQNAVAAGFSGTPFVVARNQAGEVVDIRGALPRDAIEARIAPLRE